MSNKQKTTYLIFLYCEFPACSPLDLFRFPAKYNDVFIFKREEILKKTKFILKFIRNA